MSSESQLPLPNFTNTWENCTFASAAEHPLDPTQSETTSLPCPFRFRYVEYKVDQTAQQLGHAAGSLPPTETNEMTAGGQAALHINGQYTLVSTSLEHANPTPNPNPRSPARSGHRQLGNRTVDSGQDLFASSAKIQGHGSKSEALLAPTDQPTVTDDEMKTSGSGPIDMKNIIAFNLVKNHQRRSPVASGNTETLAEHTEPQNTSARQILRAGGWITREDVKEWRKIGYRKKTPWNNPGLARRFNVRRENERRLEFERNSEFDI